MKTIHLIHDSRLAVDPTQNGPVPSDWRPPDGTTSLLTFRHTPGRRIDHVIGDVNATIRFCDDYGANVCTYGLQTDSGIAPLALWDIAHKLPVGGTLTIAGDAGPHYLEREYFRQAFVIIDQQQGWTKFQKSAPLLIESERGLDRWSFCIPTGPGDATGLNVLVQRIRELNIPKHEIILCGRPGANFKYFSEVRIVGEDLSNPPVLIGKKKNRLAESAQYENLCILHDRVFLPLDFRKAVERFGDDYPIVGFQSLWVDDPYHLTVQRYSDYGRYVDSWLMGVMNKETENAEYFRADYTNTEKKATFINANPLRYDTGRYCTGSLYLVKRKLWNRFPQSELLEWNQYEDVEHGNRVSRQGVPSRINPYAFTQTMFGRPLILNPDSIYEWADGGIDVSVSPMLTLNIRRKPLSRWSYGTARQKMIEFARKYVFPELLDLCLVEINKPGNSTREWIRKFTLLVYGSKVPFTEEGITRFIQELEKSVIGDSSSTTMIRNWIDIIYNHGPDARAAIADRSIYTRILLFLRPNGNLHHDSMSEYFPKPNWVNDWGTWLTAKRLARWNGRIIVHPDGVNGYYHAIRNSTPYRSYYEAQL